jgi:hypothetical protein
MNKEERFELELGDVMRRLYLKDKNYVVYVDKLELVVGDDGAARIESSHYVTKRIVNDEDKKILTPVTKEDDVPDEIFTMAAEAVAELSRQISDIASKQISDVAAEKADAVD